MKFLTEFLSHGRNRMPEQAATVARISIDVGGVNVTEYKSSGQEKPTPHIVMPAYVLAEGLAQRWWTLKGGRGRTVSMRRFREGFAVPDVIFQVDRDIISIEAKKYHYDNPELSFINPAFEEITNQQLEDIITSLIKSVIGELHASNIHGSILEQYEGSIRESEADADEKEFCLGAGALGLDPYCISDELSDLILRSNQFFKGEQLLEFLSSIDSRSGADALSWIESQEEQLGERIALPQLSDYAQEVRSQLDIHEPGRPAWQIGYEAATKIRGVLSKSADDRFKSPSELARALGKSDFATSSQSIQGLRAVIDRTSSRYPKILVGGGRPEPAQLFAFARAIGDTIVFYDNDRVAVTDNETRRQAIGRAFAAELLAPAEFVLSLTRKGWTASDIAFECGVSDRVVKHQIENHSAIGSH